MRMIVLFTLLLTLVGCSGEAAIGPTGVGKVESAMSLTNAEKKFFPFIVPTAAKVTLVPPGTVNGPGQSVSGLALANLAPGPYTLHFSFQMLPPTSGVKAAVVDAVITWKVNGQQVRRVVSVTNGLAITCHCEGVDVVLTDTTYRVGENSSGGEVSITLAPGVRPSIEQPPVYQDIPQGTTVPALNQVTIPVPENAGVNQFMLFIGQIGSDLNKIAVSQQDPDSNSHALSLASGIVNRWITMAPGVASLRIINQDALNTTAYVLWGIEG